MNKIAVIVLAGFIVAFAAGGSVGILAGPELPPKPSTPEHSPPPLRELELTPEQHKEMRRVWSKVGPGPGPGGFGREGERALWENRQEAMAALLAELTAEQRQRYQEINDEFRWGMDELMRKRQRMIEEAVKHTQEILTPEQARIYEEMRRHGGRRERGPGGPPAGPHHPGRPGGPGPRRGGPKSYDGRGGPFRMPFGPGRQGDPRDRRDPRGPRHTQPTTQP